jgi:hypothetical protein
MKTDFYPKMNNPRNIVSCGGNNRVEAYIEKRNRRTIYSCRASYCSSARVGCCFEWNAHRPINTLNAASPRSGRQLCFRGVLSAVNG